MPNNPHAELICSDTHLLKSLLTREPNRLANIIQIAAEYDDWEPPGTLNERLHAALIEETGFDAFNNAY